MIRQSLIALAALMISGCAAQDRATAERDAVDQFADVKKIGEAKQCLPIYALRNSTVINDRTIDFSTAGGKIYRNVLPNSCPGLSSEERFSYSTSLSQLCNVDVITVLYATGGRLDRGASCGLGKFQQIEKPKRRKG
ncbi:MAG: hypothetical protein U5J78_06595 [Parasphingorhabdus sp.]|nr:hypothetical protein [Parasphingorhabdus sp.]